MTTNQNTTADTDTTDDPEVVRSDADRDADADTETETENLPVDYVPPLGKCPECGERQLTDGDCENCAQRAEMGW